MAYTPVGLQFHTDLNYRESSPGVQLLHCLESAAEGGESTFVDGFHIAQTLRQTDPHAFDLLTRVPVPFQLRGERGHLYHKTPTICVDDEDNLVKVHFNDRTRAPLEAPAEYVSACYDALAKFNDIVNDSSNHVEFTLQPGCVRAAAGAPCLAGPYPPPLATRAQPTRRLQQPPHSARAPALRGHRLRAAAPRGCLRGVRRVPQLPPRHAHLAPRLQPHHAARALGGGLSALVPTPRPPLVVAGPPRARPTAARARRAATPDSVPRPKRLPHVR